MRHNISKVLFGLLIVLLCSTDLYAQTAKIKGVVRNATTGEIVTADTIKIMSFSQGGMHSNTVVLNSTDFTFENLGVTSAMPNLIQAVYKGVKYNTSVAIEKDGETVEAEALVYETTDNPSVFKVNAAQFFFRNLDDKLQVAQLFQVMNEGERTSTYVNENGTFRFRIDPRSSGIDFVTVQTGTVPLNQTPFPTEEHGIFAINYPIKPGITEVTVAYTVDYSTKSFSFSNRLLYDVEELYAVVSPSNMGISGQNLEQMTGHSSQDMQFYRMQGRKIDDEIALVVSGGSAVVDPGSQRIMWKENRISENKWFIMFGIAIVLLIGTIMSRNRSREKDVHKSKGSPKKLIARKEQLLETIAELDEQFEAGNVSENDYNNRRNQLKKQLTEVYKSLK